MNELISRNFYFFLFVVQPIFIRTRNIRVVTLYMNMYILTNHNL
jgi:hypothetical protein